MTKTGCSRRSKAARGGGEVVQAYCAKCHQTGAEGAPGIGDRTAWIPRLKQGFEILVGSAIKGHGPMPSRGDVANLTDSEIRAVIAYMINGGTATTTRPPVAPTAGPDRNRQINDEAKIIRALWDGCACFGPGFGVIPRYRNKGLNMRKRGNKSGVALLSPEGARRLDARGGGDSIPPIGPVIAAPGSICGQDMSQTGNF